MGTILKIGEGGWVLIGMAIGIAVTFKLLVLYIDGYFDKFKKKNNE